MRVKDFLNCVGWKIVVADIDGVLWATDSYWMRPYDGSIVQDALRYWNLDGPGVYDVEAADGDPEFDDDENYASAAPTMAIRPSVQPAYKEESLRACVTRATPERLSLLTTNGEPMLVQSSIGKLSAVYVDGDGSHTWLRRDFSTSLRALHGRSRRYRGRSRSTARRRPTTGKSESVTVSSCPFDPRERPAHDRPRALLARHRDRQAEGIAAVLLVRFPPHRRLRPAHRTARKVRLQMRVIGLDLSLTATGIAIEDGTCTVKVRTKGMQRLADLRDIVLDAYQPRFETPPDFGHLFVIEGYSMGTARQSSHAHALGELGGVVRLALFEAGVPYVDVPPACLKRYATGRGNANKGQMIEAASKRSGEDFGGDDNRVDAWWLRAMGMDALGSPLVALPATHRAALTAVTWPVKASVA